MRPTLTRALAATLALAAVQPALAQDAPDTEAFEAAALYALPHLLSGLRASCSDRLAPSGYLGTRGEALQAKFARGAEGSWSAAKVVLLELGAEKDPEMAQAFSTLPDESLRPFVDGLLTTIVATEIKPEQCGDVERGLELLAPMPVENIAGLVGFIVDLSEKYDDDGEGGADTGD